VVTVPFPGAWGHKARISNWVARVCRKGKQVTVACCRLKQFQFFCSALNKENVLDAYPHHSLCLSKTVGCHNKKQRVFYFDASKRQQHVAMSKNRERERERETATEAFVFKCGLNVVVVTSEEHLKLHSKL